MQKIRLKSSLSLYWLSKLTHFRALNRYFDLLTRLLTEKQKEKPALENWLITVKKTNHSFIAGLIVKEEKISNYSILAECIYTDKRAIRLQLLKFHN